MTWVLVAVGGMVGAPLRYLVDRAISARGGSGFPWGTLTVNVVACLLLGAVVGAVTSDDLRLLLGTGVLGALSTYSAFSYETLRLAEKRGAGALAVLNVVANLVGGVAALCAGLALGGLV